MRAELKYLISPAAGPLEDYAPETAVFSIYVQAIIGPQGGPGEEAFGFTVCSPAWLANEVERFGIVSGRHKFVMDGFDYARLEHHVRQLIAQVEEDNWAAVAEKLARWGHWEFEDYQPYPT